MYTVINSSNEQITTLWEKHFRPRIEIKEKTPWLNKMLGLIINSSVSRSSFSYDDEDNIGFFSIKSRSNKSLGCQVRQNRQGEWCPCFIEVTGFGSIRYDINNYDLDKTHPDFYRWLYKQVNIARDNFWKGGDI